jgi:hypothetical protein
VGRAAGGGGGVGVAALGATIAGAGCVAGGREVAALVAAAAVAGEGCGLGGCDVESFAVEAGAMGALQVGEGVAVMALSQPAGLALGPAESCAMVAGGVDVGGAGVLLAAPVSTAVTDR